MAMVSHGRSTSASARMGGRARRAMMRKYVAYMAGTVNMPGHADGSSSSLIQRNSAASVPPPSMKRTIVSAVNTMSFSVCGRRPAGSRGKIWIDRWCGSCASACSVTGVLDR